MYTRRETLRLLTLTSLSACLHAQKLLGQQSPQAGLIAAIKEASARFKAGGAPFSPLLLKPTAIDYFQWWKGDRTINYYRVPPDGNFCALGDVAVADQTERGPNNGSLLFAPTPGFETALAHPTGFKNVANGKPAGDSAVSYFEMLPPPGYKALGICFSDKYTNPPKKENYWCVAEQFLDGAGVTDYWSDKGARFMDNMNLTQPSFPRIERPAPDDILLIPPTFFWGDSNANTTGSSALRLKKLRLDYPASKAEMPEDSQKRGQEGDKLAPGLKHVLVLPFTALPGIQGASAGTFPFFFVVVSEYWQCFKSDNIAGTRSVEYSVGIEKSKSDTFRNRTSITLGAEAGAEAGGASAKFSASYENEMEVTATKSDSTKTEERFKAEYTVPDNTIISEWQRCRTMEFYSPKLDVVAIAPFRYHDVFQVRTKYEPK